MRNSSGEFPSGQPNLDPGKSSVGGDVGKPGGPVASGKVGARVGAAVVAVTERV